MFEMEAGKNEIFVTAPGKVILFGEHAVVYGKPALAGSLDLSTFVHVWHKDQDICLRLVDFSMTLHWTIKQMAESFGGFMCKDVHDVAMFSAEDIERLHSNAQLCVPADQRTSVDIPAVLVFLYLYSSIVGSKGITQLLPLDVEVASCLPIGAGLGSSASYTTCLSAAMLKAVDAIGKKGLNSSDLELVNQWAFSAEHILHGRPSGVDNAVSVFGGLINFKAGEITPVKCPVLEILLIDTKVKRETKTLVDKVHKRKSVWPAVVQPVLDAIGAITDTVQHNFNLGNTDFSELTQLIDMNQGLLSTLGVSHPKLDEICHLAMQYGFSGKLTGAGGGGCAYCLVPPGSVGLEELMRDLKQKGFCCWRTNVGRSGVLLHKNVEEMRQSKNNIPKCFAK
ncbi:mevalonate kinase-like [Anneissia japonica]|uniref:mevalonate kinase-like n=1 Tax=Anneissia japonica TaxID=1529436 RepID=UPI001425774B|nr:mevalonate kinase-like [Anneissia japonica]